MDVTERKKLASLLREYPVPLPTKKSEKEKDYLTKIYLWYGKPKSGKTTTAANFSGENGDMLFFCTEPGHKFQEIFKWEREDGKQPQGWNDWLTCCREIAGGGHQFKSIAIDTVDNLWKMCEEFTCNKLGLQHLSDADFGKAYHAARDEFFKPINWLGQNGYGLIFISHEQSVERQVGPRKIQYTDTTLANTAKKVVHGISDYIFYFGITDEGDRYIMTKGSENLNAGDRSGVLPEQINMDSKELIQELLK